MSNPLTSHLFVVDPSFGVVFIGTRVPVAHLFESFANGATLDEFLQRFPSVTREQVVGVLHLVRNTLMVTI